jgi:hypothetical protein
MKYESPITYHSKDIVNVKIFADRQTNKSKNYMPLIIRYRGIKNAFIVPEEGNINFKRKVRKDSANANLIVT